MKKAPQGAFFSPVAVRAPSPESRFPIPDFRPVPLSPLASASARARPRPACANHPAQARAAASRPRIQSTTIPTGTRAAGMPSSIPRSPAEPRKRSTRFRRRPEKSSSLLRQQLWSHLHPPSKRQERCHRANRQIRFARISASTAASMFPPEMTATHLSPGLSVLSCTASAAATPVAPAPSATTRPRVTSCRTASAT